MYVFVGFSLAYDVHVKSTEWLAGRINIRCNFKSMRVVNRNLHWFVAEHDDRIAKKINNLMVQVSFYLVFEVYVAHNAKQLPLYNVIKLDGYM